MKRRQECQAILFKKKKKVCHNLIVYLIAQSGTKALHFGHSPGVSSMNEPWEVNGIPLN